MTSYIPVEFRRRVAARARNSCEYCRTAEVNTLFGLQVDHIIAEKHGGETALENLALACVYCNRFKGSDIGSVTAGNTEFVRFFNPRIDIWELHFFIEGVRIVPLSPIGETTIAILQMNSLERQIEREVWILSGLAWPI